MQNCNLIGKTASRVYKLDLKNTTNVAITGKQQFLSTFFNSIIIIYMMTAVFRFHD